MRLQTTRKKIKVDNMPPVYLDMGYNDAGEVKDVFLSEPSKFGNSTIGELIAAINYEIEEGFKVIEQKRI